MRGTRSPARRAAAVLMLASLCLSAERLPAAVDVWTRSGPEGGVIDVVLAHPTALNTVYAASDGGGVFRSTNAGARWSAVNGDLGNLNARALAADPSAPGVLYLGTRGGGVFKTTNGGDAWTANSQGLANRDVRAFAVDPERPTTLYAGTAGGVFKSENGGASWRAANAGLPSLDVRALAVDRFRRSTLYAAAGGTLVTSGDGGATWTPAGASLGPMAVVALAADAFSPGRLYAGTRDGAVLRSDDRAASWHEIKEALAGDQLNAMAADPNVHDTLYVATSRGTFRSEDAGATWQRADQGLGDALLLSFSVLPRQPGTLYAAGTGGVFKSADRGRSWAPVNRELVATTVSALAVDAGQPATVYAGAFGMYRSTTEGAGWQRAADGLGTGFVFATAVAPGTPAIVYAGGAAGVFKSADRGQSWLAINQGLTSRFVFALAVDAAGRLYAGTSGGGVFLSDDGGESWGAAGLAGESVRALVTASGSPATLYAGTESGGLFMSSDGGRSWQQAGAGLPDLAVAALAVHPADPRRVYAGTRGGGVYRSDDGGASWFQVNAGLGNRTVLALAIEPSNAARVYAGTARGVFRSTNAGATWLPLGDGLSRDYVLSLAVHPTAPGKLFAGTFGGGVFAIAQSPGPSDSPAKIGVNRTAALPGQTIAVRISLSAESAAVGTAAFDLLFNADVLALAPARCVKGERLDRHGLVASVPPEQPDPPARRLRLLWLDPIPPVDSMPAGEIGMCSFEVAAGAAPGAYLLRAERLQVTRTDGTVLCGVGAAADCAAEDGVVVVVEAPATPTGAPSPTATAPPTPTPTLAPPIPTPTTDIVPSPTPVAVCGNGFVEIEEECDPGAARTACCTDRCRYREGGCDDGDPCTQNDFCTAGECRGAAVALCGTGDGCCPEFCAWTDDADCRRVDLEPRRIVIGERVTGPLLAGRFDSDETDDLLMGDFRQPRLLLLRGDGRGGVRVAGEPLTLESGTGAASGGWNDLAAADLDGDGFLDLIGGFGEGAIVTVFGDGAGKLVDGPRTDLGSPARRVLVGELDGGGWPDAVVATGAGIVLLAGRGDGTFQDLGRVPTDAPVSAVALADLNADGRLDLALAFEAAGEVRILLGVGGGGFEPGPKIAVEAPTALVLGDFTSDEWADLAVASRTGRSLAVYAGERGGPAAEPFSVLASGEVDDMLRTDLNGDGFADIVALHRSSGALSVFGGRGDGTFDGEAGSVPALSTGQGAHGFALFDANADGLPDLAVSGSDVWLATAMPSRVAPERGDANGDGRIDAPDIEANVTELFDGDGVDSLSCGGGAAACSVGADANRDGRISVADLVATLRLSSFLTGRGEAN